MPPTEPEKARCLPSGDHAGFEIAPISSKPSRSVTRPLSESTMTIWLSPPEKAT